MFKSMKSWFTRTTPTAKRSFRPMVEGLESRLLLTVSAMIPIGTRDLVITGDAQANTVQILQNDNNNEITVIGDGQTRSFQSNQIDNIKVNLGARNDTVDYRLVGNSDLDYAKNVSIDLGNGQNTTTIDLSNNDNAYINAPVTINITSEGANGQANFTSTKTQYFSAPNDTVNINIGDMDADVTINANLGIGNDNVTVNLDGYVNPGVKLTVDLDSNSAPTRIVLGSRILPTQNLDGNDTFTVNLSDNDDAVDGDISVTMNGGLGNDILSVNQEGPLNGTMNVTMDGGDGRDTLALTQFGDLNGNMNVTMNGGAGVDTFRLTKTEELNGTMDVDMLGGTQNDQFFLNINLDDSSSGSLLLYLRGEGGFGDSMQENITGTGDLDYFFRDFQM